MKIDPGEDSWEGERQHKAAECPRIARPRSEDASRRESGIRSRAVYIGMTMNGKPDVTEHDPHGGVRIRGRFGDPSPRRLNVQSRVPSLLRMTIQANTRARGNSPTVGAAPS